MAQPVERAFVQLHAVLRYECVEELIEELSGEPRVDRRKIEPNLHHLLEVCKGTRAITSGELG